MSRMILFWRIACFAGAMVLGFSSAALRADEAEDAYQRGLSVLSQGDIDQAVAAFSEAIKLKPEEAKFFGLRGTARLRKGDYEEGLADVKTAIRLNPNDLGEKYQARRRARSFRPRPWHARAATSGKDARGSPGHGAIQRTKRPCCDLGLRGNSRAKTWDRWWTGIRRLRCIPMPSTLPPRVNSTGRYLSSRNIPRDRNEGQERSFEELWAGAVFELHNINNAKEFVRLAQGGRARRDVERGLRSRHSQARVAGGAADAGVLRRRCYLPFAARKSCPPSRAYGLPCGGSGPMTRLSNLPTKRPIPGGRTRVITTGPRLIGTGGKSSTISAIELLGQMCAESEGLPDHAEVHLWAGRCRMKLGQYPEAVKELTSSIHLDPTDPAAFRNRAQVYRLLNETERANLDLKRAEELEKKEGGEGAKSEK